MFDLYLRHLKTIDIFVISYRQVTLKVEMQSSETMLYIHNLDAPNFYLKIKWRFENRFRYLFYECDN